MLLCNSILLLFIYFYESSHLRLRLYDNKLFGQHGFRNWFMQVFNIRSNQRGNIFRIANISFAGIKEECSKFIALLN